MNKKNRNILIGVISSIILVGGGVFYFTIGERLLDENKITTVESRLAEYTENSFTGAIKESVSVAQISSLEKMIDGIHDTSKRAALKSRINTSLNQASLQANTKEKINKFVNFKNKAELNKDEIQSSLEDANKIANIKVRNELVKEANEVLDKFSYAEYVEGLANSLDANSTGQYYTVKGLVDQVEFEDSKAIIEKKLTEIKKAIDTKNKTNKDTKAQSEAAAINQAKETPTYSFTAGQSTQTKLNQNQYQLYLSAINNQQVGTFLGIDDKNLVVYTVAIENNLPKITETTKIEIQRNTSGATIKLLNNPVWTGSTINTDSTVIGTKDADIIISSNNLSTLRNTLNLGGNTN